MQWEDIAGCKVLHPDKGTPPRGLVHFLGGLLVSPKPHIAYRYVLETLSQRGYLVVATPFAVDFDYTKPAGEIYNCFSTAKETLRAEYGELPQLAMGHSLGALMQVLLLCTHSEYAEASAGAALVSYNNKPASEAIPLFEQLFVPALAPLEPLTRAPEYLDAIRVAQSVRDEAFSFARSLKETALGQLVPEAAAKTLDAALEDAESLSSLVDQVPEVIASISRGTSEFSPTPSEMRSLVQGSYTQRAPLVLSFSVDSLDESPALEAALPTSADHRAVQLAGTHLTPLAVDPDANTNGLLPIPEAFGGQGTRASLLADVDAFVDEIDRYFTKALTAQVYRDMAAKRSMETDADGDTVVVPEESAEVAAIEEPEAEMNEAEANSSTEAAAWTLEEVSAMKVADLREACGTLGLDATGKKAVLVERLLEVQALTPEAAAADVEAYPSDIEEEVAEETTEEAQPAEAESVDGESLEVEGSYPVDVEE